MTSSVSLYPASRPGAFKSALEDQESVEVGTRVPETCDCDKFYYELEKAGIWYELGSLDADYFREITLKESDIPLFSKILNSWGGWV